MDLCLTRHPSGSRGCGRHAAPGGPSSPLPRGAWAAAQSEHPLKINPPLSGWLCDNPRGVGGICKSSAICDHGRHGVGSGVSRIAMGCCLDIPPTHMAQAVMKAQVSRTMDNHQKHCRRRCRVQWRAGWQASWECVPPLKNLRLDQFWHEQ